MNILKTMPLDQDWDQKQNDLSSGHKMARDQNQPSGPEMTRTGNRTGPGPGPARRSHQRLKLSLHKTKTSISRVFCFRAPDVPRLWRIVTNKTLLALTQKHQRSFISVLFHK